MNTTLLKWKGTNGKILTAPKLNIFLAKPTYFHRIGQMKLQLISKHTTNELTITNH